MSKRSNAVKEWRKRTKERIIQSFGGKCCICGYNRCNEALALHHLEPSEKEISMACIRATPIAWYKIVKELRKCILVCNNCHAEIHYGGLKIPDNVSRFDESFTTYELYVNSEKSHLLSECPVCKGMKPKYLKTCSNKCSGSLSSKLTRVDWEQYNLQEMIKTLSNVKIAEIVGCSETAIRKKRIKLGI